MDLHQLKVFHSAARLGGFTHASRELRLSQSTVSQHIKQLEEDLGCQLFIRVGKRVLLTEAGHLLGEHCERILQDVKNAEAAIRELNGMQRGMVRLGTGATTLIYQLPRVLESFQAKFPKIELVIVSDTTDVLVREIQSQRIDLGLVMLPVAGNDLQLTPLCDEELLIALPSRHPLAKRARLTVGDLRELRFILYEKKTVMRGLIDNFFASLGVTPQLAMVMENIEAIKSLVSMGLGASVLPSHAVGNDALDRKVRLLRVEGHRLHRQLALVTLKSTFIPQAVQELAKMIVLDLGPTGAARGRSQRGARKPAAGSAKAI
jgi:LysR family transcriptional activator of glutamate synthase operon